MEINLNEKKKQDFAVLVPYSQDLGNISPSAALVLD